MGKWLEKFLDKEPQKSTDSTDKFNSKTNMSVLSVPLQGVLDQNLENMSRIRTDSTDRFKSETNMSVLSVPPHRGLDKISLYPFEERLAIAEYDGEQNPIHAHRMAYLDAFISVLSSLAENDPYQDWLSQQIQTTLSILEAQNFSTLN